MKELNIYLENCYGIRKLDDKFDFNTKNTFAIYAPNGVMKTSFAKTFKDLSNDKPSQDLVFTERETIRKIQDENNNDIKPLEVFVIEPYNQQFNSDKISTLVAKKELKAKYDKILKDINETKENLFKKLKQLSGLTGKNNNIQIEIEKAFNKGFFEIIEELETKIEKGDTEFSNIIYQEIFNDKVINFLNTKDFKTQIKSYIEKYNDIIENSEYLQKDFNHYNASTVQNNLKVNGFFKAKHSLNLYNGVSTKQICEADKLIEIINEEKEKILNNTELQKEFESIDKKLSNQQLRKFRDYLFENKEIIPELENLEQFQKILWVAYLTEQSVLYKDLLQTYQKGKQEIKKIIEEARMQSTEWEQAVEEFNYRFNGLPFKLKIENKDDVILKKETPSISFIFGDIKEDKKIEKNNLFEVLSQGERRALYLLNIIFEVRARKTNEQKTIFIIDDIADSFDYKNKYAIVEYLNDISKEIGFYQIILTHNFDFFRTIQDRILCSMKWDNSFIAQKLKNEIKLLKAGEKKITNPFNIWRKSLNRNLKSLIASIPLVRNLIEYKDGNKNYDYITLTYLLHQKNENKTLSDGTVVNKTNDILLTDLEVIFSHALSDVAFEYSEVDKNNKVIDIIFQVADKIFGDLSIDPICLENKIILTIASRLFAEQFIWSKISDNSSISSNQTGELFQRYKNEFGDSDEEKDNIKILERINIITPENIHLNSFMYEPILDIGIDDLKKLYEEIKKLKESISE